MKKGFTVPKGQSPLSNYYQTLIDSFTGTPPCGSGIEYDPVYLLMQSRLQPKLGAEYGDFVESTEAVNWSEIERDCRTLLQKCIDVRLIILLIRCQMRQHGLSALTEGLEALTVLLTHFPDDLHPQLIDEGEFEPLMRTNAFSELEDADGFLADVRSLLLPNNLGLTLSLKEFEKSRVGPRDENTLPEKTIELLEQAWSEQPDEGIKALVIAQSHLQQLRNMLIISTGESAPDFSRLGKLLGLFSDLKSNSVKVQPAEQAEHDASSNLPTSLRQQFLTEAVITQPLQKLSMPPAAPFVIANRQEALTRLREIRDWFSAMEPGSPVIMLLAFTEKTIGKSFSELIRFIPMDMMSQLENDKE